ncbi:hypothetical protein [Hespellia stercorisuis]|uniref:Uncharacterized protein n=1 Tax=Hespellia stercorisuis DSM 15480 TaxID=1121950 RepID=A0A1M6RL91_9FIRM|nr:hypothetical protein [Hespellia stercorisuis]SHK33214.1 hypothetical protein SAMN02745243_02723 [Hespellia stercorisuis DSM 15480]
MKMILSDGTEVQIEDSLLSGSIIVKSETKEELMETWDMLTPDKLYKVDIVQKEDVIRSMHGVCIDSVQIVINPDGTLTTHFYIRETSTGSMSKDSDYVKAAKILLGEEV